MNNGRTLATLVGLVLLSVLILSSAAQQTTLPTPTPSRNQLLVSDAVVRGGPGESFVPVGRLTPDSLLIPVSIDTSGQWVLLRYNRGFGWIRRDLAFWIVDLDALPVITSANLTPTVEAGRETATPFFPTSTPRGSYVQTTARSAYVRAGPGRTYLRLGQLFPGDKLEPVSRNEDGSWVMIRTADGFGWIQRALGVWSLDIDSLPVINAENLTPTATFTASRTPSRTPRPSATSTITPTVSATPTHTPTLTPSPTATSTPTQTPSATATSTSTLTLTPSPTATSTPTLTLTPSETASPTPTPSKTFTHTPSPTTAPSETLTPTHTASSTITPSPTHTASLTATSAPTLTLTPSPTHTASLAATSTPTLTLTPSRTHTASPMTTPTFTLTPSETTSPTSTPSKAFTHTPTPTIAPNETPTPTHTPSSTITPSPTRTHTLTPSPTTTFTLTPTDTLAPALVIDDTTPPAPTPLSSNGTDAPSDDKAVSIPTEALVGGAGLLAILIYMGLYLRGLSAANRYKDGFIIENCPTCRHGKLSVEVRQSRLLGIPQPHFTVRCSNCRSVLREVGRGQWRYAVDPLDNPTLYERYNSRTLDEHTLLALHKAPIKPPTTPVTRPDFVEDEQPPSDV